MRKLTPLDRLVIRFVRASYGKIVPLTAIGAVFRVTRQHVDRLVRDIRPEAGIPANEAMLRTAYEDDIGRAVSDDEWRTAIRAAGDQLAARLVDLAGATVGRDLKEFAR